VQSRDSAPRGAAALPILIEHALWRVVGLRNDAQRQRISGCAGYNLVLQDIRVRFGSDALRHEPAAAHLSGPLGTDESTRDLRLDRLAVRTSPATTSSSASSSFPIPHRGYGRAASLRAPRPSSHQSAGPYGRHLDVRLFLSISAFPIDLRPRVPWWLRRRRPEWHRRRRRSYYTYEWYLASPRAASLAAEVARTTAAWLRVVDNPRTTRVKARSAASLASTHTPSSTLMAVGGVGPENE